MKVKKECEIVGMEGEQELQADTKERELRTGAHQRGRVLRVPEGARVCACGCAPAYQRRWRQSGRGSGARGGELC